MTFGVFIGHEQQKLFLGIIIFNDFLSNFRTEGLFITSMSQTLPTFNGGKCTFGGF